MKPAIIEDNIFEFEPFEQVASLLVGGSNTESRKKSEENCTKIWNKWRKVVNLRPKRWRKVAILSLNLA